MVAPAQSMDIASLNLSCAALLVEVVIALISFDFL
jgi:hypothetical protein